jgi:hypothetical protein
MVLLRLEDYSSPDIVIVDLPKGRALQGTVDPEKAVPVLLKHWIDDPLSAQFQKVIETLQEIVEATTDALDNELTYARVCAAAYPKLKAEAEKLWARQQELRKKLEECQDSKECWQLHRELEKVQDEYWKTRDQAEKAEKCISEVPWLESRLARTIKIRELLNEIVLVLAGGSDRSGAGGGDSGSGAGGPHSDKGGDAKREELAKRPAEDSGS